MTIHFCAMCDFETDDEAQAYEHDCMVPGIADPDCEQGENG